MKVIAYTRPDGGTSVCRPVISVTDPEGFTADDALQRALQNDIPPDATNVRVVDAGTVQATGPVMTP